MKRPGSATRRRPILEYLERREVPATLTVTSASDAPGAPGSLRDALARASAGDTIAFNIQDGAAVAGNRTITLRDELTVAVPVTIEGGSQPDRTTITLDGAGGAFSGLNLTSGITVRDLTVIRCLGAGIFARGQNNVISGCRLGTDATGTIAQGNGAGLVIDRNYNGAGNVTVSGCVLSGNGTDGIRVGGTRVVLVHNRIGTDATGRVALPNAGRGVLVGDASSVAIGLPGAGNVIAGNAGEGILLDYYCNLVTIQGNTVGTTPRGDRLPNAVGIAMPHDTPNVTIGGPGPGAGNVIAGNGGGGILAVGSGGYVTRGGFVFPGKPLNLLIGGNTIGLAPDGVTPMGNAGPGVSISIFDGPSPVDLEATVTGNAIAHNAGAGVAVPSGFGVAILGNRIYGNAGLGIDLGPAGVTPNAPQNPVAGAANLGQNYPVLANARTDGGVTTISGTLRSAPNATFTVQFFASDAADPSGFGQGRLPLGEATVTTDATGLASFAAPMAVAAPSLWFVTATATDAQGNTSEFSADVQAPFVPPPPPPPAAQGPKVTGVVATRDASGRLRIVVRFDRAPDPASARSARNYLLGIVRRGGGDPGPARPVPLRRPRYVVGSDAVRLATRRHVPAARPARLTVAGIAGADGAAGVPYEGVIRARPRRT